jgi:hypothetical protein
MAVAVGCGLLLPFGDVCCAVRALLTRGSTGGLPLGGGPEAAAAVTLLEEGVGGVCSRFRGVIAGGGSGASEDGHKGGAPPAPTAAVAEAGAGAARAQLTIPSVCCAAIHWRHTQEEVLL